MKNNAIPIKNKKGIKINFKSIKKFLLEIKLITTSIKINRKLKIGVKNINPTIRCPAPHGECFVNESILKK